MPISQRELTRRTGVTSTDLKNWQLRGFLTLPETTKGRERTYTSHDLLLVLQAAFARALTDATQYPQAVVHSTARKWVTEYQANALERYWAHSPLTQTSITFSKIGELAEVREQLAAKAPGEREYEPVHRLAIIDRIGIAEELFDAITEDEWTPTIPGMPAAKD